MRELVKSPSHMRPYARRSGEMRKGVEVVRVATVLRDEHCRPELPQHRRHNAVEPFEPRFGPRERHAGFNRVVPPVLRKFRPTVLVTQDGCDTHYLDPLAHLAGTTRIWPHVGGVVHELAHELCEGRWVALGGGGYAVRAVVPRAWASFVAQLRERPALAAEVT